MKIKVVKQLLWIVNAVLVVATVLFALKFFILGGARKDGVRKAEQILGPKGLKNFTSSGPTRERLPADKFRAIWTLPLSGLPPVKAVETAGGEPVRRIPPLERDYDLVSTYVDFAEPMECRVSLLKKGGAKRNFELFMVGDKVEGVWKLVRVEKDHAVFEQVSGEESVSLKVNREAALDFVRSGGPGPDEPKEPRVGPTTEVPKDRPTREAVEIKENHWSVPPEEGLFWETHGETRLEEDVTLQPVQNPDTGQAEGIMIKSITQGSVISERGVKRGDIIRSINRTPVTSRAEIVSYLKGAGKDLTRYIVEVERSGRVFTMTYTVTK